ncbi:CRAL/TRIO domain protein [Oesophagostomum dentatum]|uniref:CRAL/TRIO domain protein n=1 Tax=Oesophagostomum dentatum TaxID=61180 RepID=A0A0B1T6T9_OESDE|nr:CRAL/TRIO domain protein [Oesophagostomum dentatum]
MLLLEGHLAQILIAMFKGRIDIGGVMKSIQPTEYLHQLYRNFENFLEMIMEQEAKTGVQCSLLYVFDLDGLSFDPMLLGILSGPFRVSWQSLGTHYRELIGKFIVINTPSYINVLWSALSPFVPEQAKSRITITGRTWREDLLELAEPFSGPFRVSWQSLGTHYRELIGKFIVINTPSYINVLW